MSDPQGPPEGPNAPKQIEKIKREKEAPEKLKPEKEHPEKFKPEKEAPEKFKDEKEHPEKFKAEKEAPEKFKPEKENKLEIKEFKELKAEKNELKGEGKELKLELKDVKPEAEKPPAAEGPGGGPVETDPIDLEALARHADALEQAARSLRHFISQGERPDLSQGALQNEPEEGDGR